MKPVFSSLIIILIAGVVTACANGPVPQTVPVTDSSLFGSWTLTRVGHRAVSRGMTLDFGREGVMRGTYRCNSMSGRYDVRPAVVIFPSSVIMTAAGCSKGWPPNQRTIELAERVLFNDPPPIWSVSVNGRRLYVDGQEKLQFVREQ